MHETAGGLGGRIRGSARAPTRRGEPAATSAMARPEGVVLCMERKREAPAEKYRSEGELKRELRRLVGVIVDGGDGAVDTGAAAEALERASVVLATLMGLTVERARERNGVSGGGHVKRPSPRPLRQQQQRALSPTAAMDAVPDHFLCPISSELMKDPVVLATGQTYDRPFIQAWLDAGHRTCPQTQQVLPHPILTPNHLLRRIISDWCESHGVISPPRYGAPHSYDSVGALTHAERLHLTRLLDKLSSPSASEQCQAARELRLLTKRKPSARALLGETPHAVPRLLTRLSSPELQEDVVTTMLNLSIDETNKKLLGDNPQVIPLLVQALSTGGSMEARGNAAAALFALSALDANKAKIGESGAMKPLVGLMEQGSYTAKKDAASAVFSLCMARENRRRAVEEGVVGVLMKAVSEKALVDESLCILAMLVREREAVEEMDEGGAGVGCLLRVMRESRCGRSRENAAVVLYAVCVDGDRRKLREVREEEEAKGTVSDVARSGTPRARRKAAGILDRLSRNRDLAYVTI